MVIFCCKYLQRQLSHMRFTFLLIIVLNTLDMKDRFNHDLIKHKRHFKTDLEYCYKCFETQIEHCSNFFQRIQPHEELSIRQLFSFLPEISSKRNNQLMKLINSNEKVVIKYLFKRNKLSASSSSNIEQLKREFLKQQENLQGVQYAPLKNINNFIRNLQKFHANFLEITIWNYLLNNIQPLILPILYEGNFPVPKAYALCGFTLYQQYGGEDLYNFFQGDFFIKLEISKQLLEAAIKFSHGFDNYRLYITDLTADNIVYDRTNHQIYFIDLDTIFIVDSAAAKYKSLIHKYIYMECPGCFAYSENDIASYNISDINIYLVCQFLREDVYREQSKGFLYPIPAAVIRTDPILWWLLNKCVDCPENLCSERFTVAKELIGLFEKILQN